MKERFLGRIEVVVEPWRVAGPRGGDRVEFRFRVGVDGQDTASYTKILPTDHLVSDFDRVMEMVVEEVRRGLEKSTVPADPGGVTP